MSAHEHDNKILSPSGEMMLSARKVAKRLDCAPDYVGRLCREGKLKGVRVRNAWFVDERSVTRFEASRVFAKQQRAEELSEQRRREGIEYKKQNAPTIERARIHASEFVSKYRVPQHTVVAFGVALVSGALVCAAATAAVSLSVRSTTFGSAVGTADSPLFGVQTASVLPVLASLEDAVVSTVAHIASTLFVGTGSQYALNVKKTAQTNSSTTPTISNTATRSASVPSITLAQSQPQIIQHNTYPVVERTILKTVVGTSTGVTEAELDTKLEQLSASIQSHLPGITTPTGYVAMGGAVTNITQTIQPVVADDYLPLSGGALTGPLTSALNDTATTTSTFGGSIDLLSGCFSLNGICVIGAGSTTLAVPWGNMTGSIANQTDLQQALNTKLALADWYATTTDALAEGTTNKYYTDDRVNAYLDASSTVAKTYANNTFTGNNTFGNLAVATFDVSSGLITSNGTSLAFASPNSEDTTFGLGAGNQNQLGTDVTGDSSFGYQALASDGSGIWNTAVGTNALNNNDSGSFNTSLGASSLVYNNAGSGNTALGYASLFYNTNAASTTAVGFEAGVGRGFYANKGSTLVGAYSGFNNTNRSDYNTFLGTSAGWNVTTGSDNILIGVQYNAGGPNALSTGSNNIGIGWNTAFPSALASNQLNIGNMIYGTIPATSTDILLHAPTTGAIGIGTTSPWAKFAVQTNNGDTATTLFAIASSTALTNTTLFSVDNTGSTTIANGVNLTSGCFAVNGSCLSSASSTLFADSNLFSGANTFSGTNTFLGNNAFATVTASAFILPSLTNAALAVNSVGGVYAAATTTAGTGLAYSGNTFNVTGLTTTQFASPNISQWTNDAKYFATTSTDYFLSQRSTSNLAEGTNLYFTSARAQAALAGLYESPLTFSTGLTRVGNIIAATFGTTSLSAGAGIAYNTTTGQITNTGILTNAGDWAGTWQGNAPSAFQPALGYTPYNATNPSNYIALGALSASAPLSYNNTTGQFTITQAGTGANGYLSSTDWNTFNNKQPAGNYDTFAYPFALAGNATSTLVAFNGGLTSYASTTIGDGNQTGGLTVSGGATTTGNAYFGGNVGIGTATPYSPLFVVASNNNNFLSGIAPSNVSEIIRNNSSVNNNYSGIGFDVSGATSANYTGVVGAYRTGAGGQGGLYFAYQPNTAGGNGTIGAVLSQNGYFGIGTTTPYAQLSVATQPNANGSQSTLFAIASSTNYVSGAATSTLFAVTNSGNVGIGTAAPNSLFEVTGVDSASTPLARVSNSSSTYLGLATQGIVLNRISNSASNLNLTTRLVSGSWGVGGGSIVFNPNNIEAGRFISTGSFGIGTTSPFAQLSVATQPNANGSQSTLFAIASSTNYVSGAATSTLFSVSNTGAVSMNFPANSSSLTIGQSGSSQQVLVNASSYIRFGVGLIPNAAMGGLGTVGAAWNTYMNYATTTNTAYFGSNVGIGTTSPYAKLSVHANNGETNTTLFAIASSTATATTTLFSVSNTGVVTINGPFSCTLGNGSSVSNCSSASDQRLKDNITSLNASSSLSAIDQLNAVSFDWNAWMLGNGASTSTQYGFIAQDVAKIFPNLVHQNSSSGYFTLDYQGLFAPIVGAIQEISHELSALEATVAGFAESFTSKQVTTDKLCVTKSGGGSVCVTGDQLQQMLSGVGVAGSGSGASGGSLSSSSSSGLASGSGNSGSSAANSPTAPVLTVVGDSPTSLTVGDTYSDLGVTIVDAASPNIGYQVSVDGGATTTPDQIHIDTSAAGTHTIIYSATDQAGLTGYATRTVNVASSTPAH